MVVPTSKELDIGLFMILLLPLDTSLLCFALFLPINRGETTSPLEIEGMDTPRYQVEEASISLHTLIWELVGRRHLRIRSQLSLLF
jgi:hypothetical protein